MFYNVVDQGVFVNMSMLKSPIIIVEESISICFNVISNIEMK
jgi:hypothetical protein